MPKTKKKVDKNDTIKVFTDGACRMNGSVNAKAGIGVYFGKDDQRNVSKPLQNLWVKGRGNISNKIKQTNNTAELSAVVEVFCILKARCLRNFDLLHLIILSSSIYAGYLFLQLFEEG